MKTVVGKLDEFFSGYPKRLYPKDQIIIFVGENTDKLFYLYDGQVALYDTSYRGDDVTLNMLSPQAIFPMAHALEDHDNKFFYKAAVDTTVHIAPKEDVLEFISNNPDVAMDIIQRLFGTLERMYGRLVYLMSGSAGSRIMYEIIMECHRIGTSSGHGSYLLSIHEKDLAARTGLSRETVSRELRRLKDKQLAYSDKQAIRVLDLPKLEIALDKTA